MTIITTDQRLLKRQSYLIGQLIDNGQAQQHFPGEELPNLPPVGAALPLENAEFTPRVFCFLPLPHNRLNETGFGIHINGSFAINQSRTGIKVTAQDQIFVGLRSLIFSLNFSHLRVTA